jgi:hypothetical protein
MFSLFRKPSKARLAGTAIARVKEAGGPDFGLDLDNFEIPTRHDMRVPEQYV